MGHHHWKFYWGLTISSKTPKVGRKKGKSRFVIFFVRACWFLSPCASRMVISAPRVQLNLFAFETFFLYFIALVTQKGYFDTQGFHYHKDIHSFISFFYVLSCITSFQYLSITCNAFIACYIICDGMYVCMLTLISNVHNERTHI